MSDYWGDERQPVCPILERSMVVCIFIRVSNPVKTKSRQNKNRGNDFSLSKAAKQSKARQDHYVWVCENNKKVLTTINS